MFFQLSRGICLVEIVMIAGRTQQSSALDVVSTLPVESQLTDDVHGSARYKSNDAVDIGALFARYSRLVLVTAYRVLGDLYEAEDVVQDVFLYLHLKWHLFDPSKGSMKSWIIQIALCRALDRKLHLARRGFYAEEDIELLRLPETRSNPEQHVEARLKRKHIEKALSTLTYMQRKTLQAFYFEGLNLRDISEQLKQPLGSVRHYLYRGLGRLRKNSMLHRLH
jgi:RNA polymerase sigma-70 factor (ECF subfamily)